MKAAWTKWALLIAVFLASLAFVIKFGFPQLLRAYIQAGVGDCSKIPVLCMAPQEVEPAFKIDKDYLQGLTRLRFPNTEISVPKGFKVVQELVSKPYYKKRRPRNEEAVIYLIHQPPGFFIKLFPQVKKMGISDNYAFFRALIYSRESGINSADDAFFVILKSIFTPDLGDQKSVKMIQFKSNGRGYFINYNLSGRTFFFDCAIITESGDFFKVYIKDTRATLDLDKVFSILSTLLAV